MATVAVVGLGAMGSRIARRLADAGNDLVVWNRDPGKNRALGGGRRRRCPEPRRGCAAG
jgi:3-hydroxyisobutyrate dehydrogenase-like beta-hydroxyacid dehydrogenase